MLLLMPLCQREIKI